MDNQIGSNNGVNETGAECESFSPGRCSMVQQHGPGRHQATAAVTRRKKWTQDDNGMVMKCYYESVPSKNGYRKRLCNYGFKWANVLLLNSD